MTTVAVEKGVKRFDLTLIDKVAMPAVMEFTLLKLASYETHLIEWIKLLPLNKKAILHGCCTYPLRIQPRARRYKSGYRIRASVNIELPPPYIFQHWGRIPSRDYKQGWYSGAVLFQFNDLEECAVHTLAHESFHFLSHSKQLRHKNTEANANWWADRWTQEFVEWRLARFL